MKMTIIMQLEIINIEKRNFARPTKDSNIYKLPMLKIKKMQYIVMHLDQQFSQQ